MAEAETEQRTRVPSYTDIALEPASKTVRAIKQRLTSTATFLDDAAPTAHTEPAYEISWDEFEEMLAHTDAVERTAPDTLKQATLYRSPDGTPVKRTVSQLFTDPLGYGEIETDHLSGDEAAVMDDGPQYIDERWETPDTVIVTAEKAENGALYTAEAEFERYDLDNPMNKGERNVPITCPATFAGTLPDSSYIPLDRFQDG